MNLTIDNYLYNRTYVQTLFATEVSGGPSCLFVLLCLVPLPCLLCLSCLYVSVSPCLFYVCPQQVAKVLLQTVMVVAPVGLFRITQVSLPASILNASLASEIAIQKNALLQNTQQV